jgi:hypothetical protein
MSHTRWMLLLNHMALPVEQLVCIETDALWK